MKTVITKFTETAKAQILNIDRMFTATAMSSKTVHTLIASMLATPTDVLSQQALAPHILVKLTRQHLPAHQAETTEVEAEVEEVVEEATLSRRLLPVHPAETTEVEAEVEAEVEEATLSRRLLPVLPARPVLPVPAKMKF